MPISVHKLLIHGAQIITSSLLSIGRKSEDAQEYCSKYIKRLREGFTQKCPRFKTMEDFFQRLLLTSNTLISLMKLAIVYTLNLNLLLRKIQTCNFVCISYF